MSGAKHIAANITAPQYNETAVISTSTTCRITTLSATTCLGNRLGTQFLTMYADGGDVTFFMKTTAGTAADTVSAAASDVTNPTQRGWKLKDGTTMSFRLRRNQDGTLAAKMHHVCSAAAKRIRLYISGETVGKIG